MWGEGAYVWTIKGFLVRNWFKWLCRLRSPKIRRWQARDPGGLMGSSSPSPKAWEPGEPMVEVPVPRPALQDLRKADVSDKAWRPGKSQCLSSSTRRESSLLLTLFVRFKSSVNWMRPTYIREDNLLYSVYPYKC